MLDGTRIAQPQPLATTCCCHVGPLPCPPPKGPPRKTFVPPGAFVPRRKPPNPPKPNSIITGTGAVALAGVVNVNWMSALISGHKELSTRPTSCFVMMGTSPLFV